MQIMQARLEKQEFNQTVEVLQELIQIACDYTIPKLKITAMSKSWWNSELTLLRKDMAKEKKVHQSIQRLLYSDSIPQQEIAGLKQQKKET